MDKNTKNAALFAAAATVIAIAAAPAQDLFAPHLDGTELVVPWSYGTGCVEMSDALEGPWTPVFQETLPPQELRIPVRNPNGFFRVKVGDLSWPAQALGQLEPLGLPIEPEQFVQLTTELLAHMKLQRPIDVEIAVEMVRVANTIEQHNLSLSDQLFEWFAEIFEHDYLDQCVEALNANLTTGLSYYSSLHDIAIGGLPRDNSQYRNAIPVNRKSGGVNRHTLDIYYTVPNWKDCCEGLNVVQVFWGSRRKDNWKIGDRVVAAGGKNYDTFVDGGKNSPGGEVVKDKPYYYTAGNLSNPRLNIIDGDTIRVVDGVTAMPQHAEGYFETAIICVNWKKSGKDKVLKVFKWGFKGCGVNYRTSFGDGAISHDSVNRTNSVEEYSSASQEFMDTLAHDYPNYKLTNN